MAISTKKTFNLHHQRSQKIEKSSGKILRERAKEMLR